MARMTINAKSNINLVANGGSARLPPTYTVEAETVDCILNVIQRFALEEYYMCT